MASPSLLALPDELILEISSHLAAIRSDEPQSQAFDDKINERSRQRENSKRRLGLHGLCLTSRRLSSIATPALYSSFTGSTTMHGITPLRTFVATIARREDLAQYLLYFENRLGDYLGNSLLKDSDLPEAMSMVLEYFFKISCVIKECPNIEQLCIVSLESHRISLWEHLIPDWSHLIQDWTDLCPVTCSPPLLNLRKLHTLALQTNMKQYYQVVNGFPSTPEILSALGILPSLTVLRVSGLESTHYGWIPTITGPFKSLRRLEIIETTLLVHEVNDLLRACDCLEHFKCSWSMLFLSLDGPLVVVPDVIKHRQSLQSLYLVPEAVDFSSWPDPPHFSFPALRHLGALKEAKLCNFCVPDPYNHTQAVPPGLGELLPASLESLAISYCHMFIDPPTYGLTVLSALWVLANHCEIVLPRLREIKIYFQGEPLESSHRDTSRSVGSVDELTEKFRKMGVDFKVIKNLKEVI